MIERVNSSKPPMPKNYRTFELRQKFIEQCPISSRASRRNVYRQSSENQETISSQVTVN
jgi:hypothetical protein